MISCRHSLVELEQADEIKVDYKDIARLADFVTDKWKCEKDIYIYIPREQIVNWENLKIYQEILNIYIAVEDTNMIETAKEHGYKTFWSYPASSYWELRGLIDLGVDQVILDAPLYFDLTQVKKVCGDIEIRLVANRCINGYMKRKNGICGTYIRPEDIDIYADFVDHIEFDTQNDLRKEMTLLKIYKEKYWPGNLNILLDYLEENVDNRGFDEDFALNRINCRQVCQRNGTCHYCETTFALITTILKNKNDIAQQIRETSETEVTKN